MADDIDTGGKIVDEHVTVPVDHLLLFAEPEGVAEFFGKVNRTDDWHVMVVEGVVIKELLVELQHLEAAVIGLVDIFVLSCGLPLKPDGLAR